MIYISEVDELRDEVKKLTQAMKLVAKPLNKIAEHQPITVKTETYRNMDEICTRTAVTGFQENTVLQKDEEKNNA